MSWIGFVLVALMIAVVIQSEYTTPNTIPIDRFWSEAKEGKYKTVTVSDDAILGTYKPTKEPKKGVTRFKVAYRVGDEFDAVVERVRSTVPEGTEIRYEQSTGPLINMLINLIPWLLIFGFIWFFVLRQLRASAGGAGMLGNFGRSRHRVSNKELTNITFNDVAGVEEAKDEVAEIIEFLKNPKKFQRLGGRIPRGVLLVGDPGCGKTLLAKAIAGEADVPFFSISGADFVEMFVGVGASRVRDLFKSAKENSPCIIFLDEIDAVGRRRGSAFNGGGHDEREQTLNAILVEMDGFDTSDQVIVIAATNRDDILDPALTRPGRFDRRVFVPLPDLKGRLEILKVHARKVKMTPGVNLMRLARGTPMFSGAELAAIINEAALMATMQNKDAIEMEDLEESRDKVRYGRSNKSRAIEEKEREATAYHEAGHAVLQTLLPQADPLHKVTIIPRGRALGATMSLPEKDRYGFGAKWLYSTLRLLCGGRIAEARHSGDVSSGAAMDIEQATKMAKAMVLEWGMSEKLGFVKYSPDNRGEMLFGEKPYSDDTARLIDEEVRRFIDEAYSDAERMLGENWEKVDAVAQALLKHETLDAEEVRRLCRGETLDRPSLSGLLANEVKPTMPAVQPRPELPGLGGTVPQPG
jgi:cell division protease FtsH